MSHQATDFERMSEDELNLLLGEALLKNAMLSEDELNLLLGEALLKNAMWSGPETDSNKRLAGKNWFKAHLSVFANALCDSGSLLQKLVGKSVEDRNLLIAGAIDVLLKVKGFPVPGAVLTAKILHYGVDQLCRCGTPEG